MYPILFSFWKITIYSHGVLVALGIIAGGYLIYYLAKEENLKTHRLLDLFLYAIVAGLIGARLNYIIIYHGYFSGFWDYLAVWKGGMVSFGGLIAGFAAAIWYLHKLRENIWKWLDLGIIGLMLGWAIGRVGCLLAGDIVGKPTDSFLGISTPAIDVVSRHPVAGYESLAAITIFAVLLFIYKSRALKDGLLFFMGFALYFLSRFGIDFTREYLDNIWGLSASQITIIVLLVMILGGFIFRYKYSK